jgi:uncharacterized protein YprB with RNaseH-like and TPR domain/predicted RNA-binding Zn-ribbon protein involved in translation (DUF1610 family)
MEIKQKVLFFDIETSPNLAYVWDKYEQDVIAFEKERDLMSFAYKWQGGKTKVCSLGKFKPRQLILELHKLFDEADIIIAHNADRFDIRMSNGFFLKYGLKPPSPYKTIDTLKIARKKFKLNSNSLNDLGTFLKVGEKVDTGGFKLWISCLRNKPGSWRKMEKYNKRDVDLLEKVFNIIGPWDNANLEYGFKCPFCGSTNVQKRGWNINKVYKSKRFQCQNCGRWASSNKKERFNTKEYLK